MLNADYYLQIFHEIKNSITLINSYLQLIERKYPEVVDYTYWFSTRSETSRLRSIVSEFSQLRPGSKLHLETTDLCSFITDCCNSFQCYIDEAGMSYNLIMPKYPLMVSIDCKQFHHVFVNLLKNACEAMQPHGQIHIAAFRQTNHAVIYIKDSGHGIAPALISHIFDSFVTTKEDGSGLGLSISQQIIHAHMGTISAESQEDVGTTFTITLPCQPLK